MDTSQPSSPHPAQPRPKARLRQYRLAAGLSQEELAERAGLSAQGLSALENGRRQAPYRYTVTLLAQALGLSTSETAALEATVVRKHHLALVSGLAEQQTAFAKGFSEGIASPVRSLRPAHTNLPVALSSFIGRPREQVEVRTMLETARVLTLTGAGGVGKTRLALAVAQELEDHYADGVWLVELAPLAAALLRDCPSLRLLTTSREGLSLAGEQLYRVPP